MYICAAERPVEEAAGGRSSLLHIVRDARTTAPVQFSWAQAQKNAGGVNLWDTHLTLKLLLVPAQRELRFALLHVHWSPWLLNA